MSKKNAVLKFDELISKNEVIVQVLLSKDKFKSVEEAVNYCREQGFYYEAVSESETQYIIDQMTYMEDFFTDEKPEFFDYAEGVICSKRKIEERDSCEIEAGPMSLSLKNGKSIKFSEGVPSIIELAKVVTGHHARYGEVKITQEDLKSFVRNFKENVVGVDISIDFDHSQSEACGWIKEVFLSADQNTLYGIVKWTPSGALALSDRKFRYFSPEFVMNYVHPHSGQTYGPTLLGGGLVNRPFLKMAAIVELNNKTINQKSEDNRMSTILLADHEKAVKALEGDINGLKTLSEGLKEENKKLSEKLNAMEEEKKIASKTSEFEKLLSEGKACEAQREAFLKGDLEGFIKLSANLNPSPKGKGGENEAVVLSEEEKTFCKKYGIEEADYIKFNS